MSNLSRLSAALNVTVSESIWNAQWDSARDRITEALGLVLADPTLDPTDGEVRDCLHEARGVISGAVLGECVYWLPRQVADLQARTSALIEAAADALLEG